MSITKTSVPLEVRNYGSKGRGVCLLDPIVAGTIIESFPVLVITPETYAKVKELPFINHTFVWQRTEHEEYGALGFGFASLCNHSDAPNAVIQKNLSEASIDLIALQDIQPNEEVTIRYNNTYFDVL